MHSCAHLIWVSTGKLFKSKCHTACALAKGLTAVFRGASAQGRACFLVGVKNESKTK